MFAAASAFCSASGGGEGEGGEAIDALALVLVTGALELALATGDDDAAGQVAVGVRAVCVADPHAPTNTTLSAKKERIRRAYSIPESW